MKKIIPVVLFLFLSNFTFSQSYQYLKTKEEFDFYNSLFVNRLKPCELNPESDAENLGIGVSYLIDAYVTMYKATGDKAYLYKCVMQSLCIVKNRHDIVGINSDKRWADRVYLDGNILGAMARFVYLVKVEDQSLQNTPLYPFPEITNNPFNQSFQTFGAYVNWLSLRINESLNWFISENYWTNSLGLKKNPDDKNGAEINMQVGFGRALLFMGLSCQNLDYIQKTFSLVYLIKSDVAFYDLCDFISYNNPVFIHDETNNSYWWYHSGWRVQKHCIFNTPDYDQFVEYIEDASHGAVVTQLFLDYYNYQPFTMINTQDLIRLRNTFSKNIYDQNGVFHKAVNGQNSPVYPTFPMEYTTLNYIPFAQYDGADITATPPNVYNIVMGFYATHIANSNTFPTLPYYNNGMSILGHAEVVHAQWEKECTDLTIYNRKLVYNQNFKSKGTLTIAPQQYDIYHHPLSKAIADPVQFQEDLFLIDSNVTAFFEAGDAIVFKPGTQLKPDQCHTIRAFINPSLCSDFLQNPTRFDLGDTVQKPFDIADTVVKPPVKPEDLHKIDLTISPNPFTNYTNVQFTILKQSVVSLNIIDKLGRVLVQPINNDLYEEGAYNIQISGEILHPGLFYCILIIDNQIILRRSIIKI